jgi:hypothetical protein
MPLRRSSGNPSSAIKLLELDRSAMIARFLFPAESPISVRPTPTRRGSLQHLCVGTRQTGVGHRLDLCWGEPAEYLRTSHGQDPIGAAHVGLL